MTEPPQMTTEVRFAATVRPLTKCKADGTRYERVPLVQEAMESVAGMTFEKALVRSQITDRAESGYLPPECLVYFVREAQRQDQRRFASSFMEALLKRCVRAIQRQLQSLTREDAFHAYNDVVSDLTESIIDLSHDRGDYFQVRFMSGLKCRTTTVWTAYRNRANQTAGQVHLGTGGDDVECGGRQEVDLADPRATAPPDVIAQREECSEALGQLPEALRELFLLKACGWPIQSNDPHTPTLSTHFRVTPRTIQNRLARANDRLKQWRERQQS